MLVFPTIREHGQCSSVGERNEHLYSIDQVSGIDTEASISYIAGSSCNIGQLGTGGDLGVYVN